MSNPSIAEQEDLIKESLFTLVKKYIPGAQLTDIDEIALSYVISILEDISSEAYLQDAFEVESFCEMLSAYLPEFEKIEQRIVCDWVFEISATVHQKKQNGNGNIKDFDEPEKDAVKLSINRLNLSGNLPSTDKARNSSSECSNPEYIVDISSGKKRYHLLSEASDASSDSSGDYSGQEDSYLCSEVQLLQEMFPESSIMEVRHCLSIAEGDIEKAAQMVLDRQEAGQSLSNNTTVLQPTTQKPRKVANDEELKNRIIARYSYVDKSDDVREHRPVAPKSEPKKLVRYRDNKIVSLKGERYTEVKKEDGEEQSSKVLKPVKAKPSH